MEVQVLSTALWALWVVPSDSGAVIAERKPRWRVCAAQSRNPADAGKRKPKIHVARSGKVAVNEAVVAKRKNDGVRIDEMQAEIDEIKARLGRIEANQRKAAAIPPANARAGIKPRAPRKGW